jgi:hypothetical protein
MQQNKAKTELQKYTVCVHILQKLCLLRTFFTTYLLSDG